MGLEEKVIFELPSLLYSLQDKDAVNGNRKNNNIVCFVTCIVTVSLYSSSCFIRQSEYKSKCFIERFAKWSLNVTV